MSLGFSLPKRNFAVMTAMIKMAARMLALPVASRNLPTSDGEFLAAAGASASFSVVVVVDSATVSVTDEVVVVEEEVEVVVHTTVDVVVSVRVDVVTSVEPSVAGGSVAGTLLPHDATVSSKFSVQYPVFLTVSL